MSSISLKNQNGVDACTVELNTYDVPVSARHRGGGHKQQYRIIDFKRNKDGVPAKVATIEYDPNRTCRIALLQYRIDFKRNKDKDLKIGDLVPSGLDEASAGVTKRHNLEDMDACHGGQANRGVVLIRGAVKGGK